MSYWPLARGASCFLVLTPTDEECRDELIIYDSVADVRDAYSNAGLKPLVVSDKILHEALDVTCRASCRRGAAKAV